MRYLPECAGEGAGGRLSACVLLRLLVVWLHGCPLAVAALLDHASHLPLLVDMVTGRVGGGDPHISGEGGRVDT